MSAAAKIRADACTAIILERDPRRVVRRPQGREEASHNTASGKTGNIASVTTPLAELWKKRQGHSAQPITSSAAAQESRSPLSLPAAALRATVPQRLHSYKTLTGRRQRHPQPWAPAPPTT